MERKRLNVPALKIRKMPIIWISEHNNSEWRCNACAKTTETAIQFFAKKDDAYNVLDKNNKPVSKNIERAVPVYVCPDCAHTKLQEALDAVNIVKNTGAKGYMFQSSL